MGYKISNVCVKHTSGRDIVISSGCVIELVLPEVVDAAVPKDPRRIDIETASEETVYSRNALVMTSLASHCTYLPRCRLRSL